MKSFLNYSVASLSIVSACIPAALQANTKQNTQQDSTRPNVIVVLTDDQGIGDLGCQGNPWLKTPQIDAFHKQAVRLTNFHVCPLSTPTRGAIISGRYPIHNGAWATYKGRDLLERRPESSPTIAELFLQNGYSTAHFGKWHLGDNYPSRPTDCGFELSIQHLSGGVGELSDYWGNSYFDDVYHVNNKPKHFDGYCTDVWFDQTMKFIKAQKEDAPEQPFFVYLATNAAHSPHIVADKYRKPFEKLEAAGEIIDAGFYGQIANLDENFGHLMSFLKKEKLRDNTIVIFLTDNGTAAGLSRDGKRGYNAGFKGKKGAPYEGGHRVPCFIQWPAGHIEGGRDENTLTAHVDLLPTLANLCTLNLPITNDYDGLDLTSLLTKGTKATASKLGKPVSNAKNKKWSSCLSERTVFIHHRQDYKAPFDVKRSSLMNGPWRLINGNQLYNIVEDKAQTKNVAKQHPDIVKKMLASNKYFTTEAHMGTAYNHFVTPIVGTRHQRVITFTIQHAMGENGGIWMPEHITGATKSKNNAHAITFAKSGRYRISCARWPRECPGPILGIPAENPKNMFEYKAISPKAVSIKLNAREFKKPIKAGDTEVSFETEVTAGDYIIEADFIDGKDKYGVYYMYVEPV